MPKFLLPDRIKFEETGETRRVGYEIEFAGLDLDQVAGLIADVFNGNVIKETEAECFVSSPGFDDFKIELDWEFGKRLARDRRDDRESQGEEEPDPFMEWVTSTAALIVPTEVVCPPIPIDELSKLDDLILALRNAGARGTEASPVYAFGVHINPELPDLEAQTIHNYLRAFSLSQEWLMKVNDVDIARRISPYIDLYPDEYIETLMRQQEHGTVESIMDLYLEHNPTRNRALDMTPLFRHINEERLVNKLDDRRINARPTFHYRVPNSTPETPDWFLSDSWRIWCVIEHLAQRPDELDRLAAKRLEHDPGLLSLEDPPWFDELNTILENL